MFDILPTLADNVQCTVKLKCHSSLVHHSTEYSTEYHYFYAQTCIYFNKDKYDQFVVLLFMLFAHEFYIEL